MDAINAEPLLLDRILVPLDGSPLADQVIPYVQALAKPGTEAILIRVMPPAEPVRDPLGGVVVATDEVRDRYHRIALRDLHRAAEPLRPTASGVRVHVVAADGDPAEEILHAARDLNVGLIVLASQGRGAIGRLAFGSVADRVARSAEYPVMVVRPRDAQVEARPAPIRRIVVPLDGSELAAQALPVAEGLARRLNASMLLVSVIDVARVTSPAIAYAAAFSQPLYEELFAGIQVDAQRMLEGAGARLMTRGVPVTWTVLGGPTAEAIMEATCPGDLIVMTSHGRSGVKRWVIGSVAEKLVRGGPVPVILLPARVPAEPTTPVVDDAIRLEHAPVGVA